MRAKSFQYRRPERPEKKFAVHQHRRCVGLASRVWALYCVSVNNIYKSDHRYLRQSAATVGCLSAILVFDGGAPSIGGIILE